MIRGLLGQVSQCFLTPVGGGRVCRYSRTGLDYIGVLRAPSGLGKGLKAGFSKHGGHVLVYHFMLQYAGCLLVAYSVVQDNNVLTVFGGKCLHPVQFVQ